MLSSALRCCSTIIKSELFVSCWFTTSIVLSLEEVLTLLLRGLEGVPLVLIFCFLSILLLLFLRMEFLLVEELFLEVAVIDERLDEVGEDGDFI